MWRRVLAPTVVISALWIAVSVATTFYINWLTESHARVLAENVTTIQAGGSLQDVLWRLHAAVTEATTADHSEARIEISRLEQAFQDQLDAARQSAFTTQEQMLVDAIEKSFQAYSEHVHRRLSPQPAPAGDASPPVGRTMRMALAIEEPCRQLVELNERLLSDSTARNARFATVVILVRLVFLIVGPVVGVLFGFWVARSLHRTISQISITLNDAASGLEKTVGSVKIEPGDDLPALQDQVHAVSAQVRQVVGELEQARRESMRAERLAAVGELAAGIAHELRNPLTSVKLLIQTAAQRSPKRSLSDQQLLVVQQEVARMENTIQGLLDFARPSRLHRIGHDVRETVRRAVNLVSGRACQQKVHIEWELPETPVPVDGDPEQLHQVFVNVALNGIESMAEGGTLRVVLRPESGGGTCRIAFCDSGSGIPATVRDRLFEPFVTTKEHGTGLGLAVSRRIVEEHGGTLTVANREEGGAASTVELPCSPRGPSQRETPGRVPLPDSKPTTVELSCKCNKDESAHAHAAGHRR